RGRADRDAQPRLAAQAVDRGARRLHAARPPARPRRRPAAPRRALVDDAHPLPAARRLPARPDRPEGGGPVRLLHPPPPGRAPPAAATEPRSYFPLPSRDLPGGAPTHASSFNSSAQASGVRDYAPGDPVNRVHWRSTARLGRLIVKEVEHEPTADLWLALDLDAEPQRGTGPAPTEEAAVTAPASAPPHA